MEYKVEYLDRVHDKLFDKEESDRVIRTVVTFKNDIDIDKLQIALDNLIKSVPYVNTSWVDKTYGDRWVTRQTSLDIISSVNTWESFSTSYTGQINETQEAQIKLIVFKNFLGILVNNMICDIFACKHIVEILLDCYKNSNDVNYLSPFSSYVHGRDFKTFKNHFTFWQRFKMHLIKPWKKLDSLRHNSLSIPFSTINPQGSSKFISSCAVYKPEVDKLIEFAIQNNTTVPIIYLAIYAKAIANTRNAFDTPINIGKFFDVRNDVKEYYPICNLYTILPIVVKIKKSDTLLDIVKQIKTIVDYITTNKIPSAKIVCHYKKIFEQSQFFQFIDLGRINEELNEFNNTDEIIELYMTSAGRNIPYFALTSITYNNCTHFCCVNYCNTSDLSHIQYLLDWIKYEVQTLIYSLDNKFYLTYNEEAYANDIYLKGHPKTSKSKQEKININELTNEELINKYKELTDVQLIPVDEKTVKYQIKGKKTFQKRTYEQIRNFIEYRINKNKHTVTKHQHKKHIKHIKKK